MDAMLCGIYEHYKGDLYWVTGYATDSTNAGTGVTYVSYVSLRTVMDVVPRSVSHVREAKEFHEIICSKRGCAVWGKRAADECRERHAHAVRPRFMYLRPV